MSKLSDKQELVLQAFQKQGGNVTQACKLANVSRTTFYEWVNTSDEFRQKRDDAIEGLYDFVESKLIKAINDENITAIIFFCKTKMKQRGYVERQELDHGKGVPVREVKWEVVEPNAD